MGKSRVYLSLLMVAIINFFLFQNCVANRFGSSDSESSNTKGTETDSTGQPYDGKIYVIAGAVCADGTFVQSRIVVKSATSATVVRENCKDTNRDIGAGEFSFSGSQLVYKSLSFTKELPATIIPLLTSWYYQLTGALQSHPALVYDIDLFETTAAQIQSLKQAGHIVICNLSTGTSENWRPDAGSFQTTDLGNNVNGSPGERWLDTRSTSVRAVMLARLDLAKSKGCNGVDLDTADGYTYNTGFALSMATQIEYNQYLAFAAHDRQLIAALKNTADLVPQLVDIYDFAIAGECYRYNECDKYQPFIAQGKAVLGAEFTAYSASQCTTARNSSVSLSYFNEALDGSAYQSCP